MNLFMRFFAVVVGLLFSALVSAGYVVCGQLGVYEPSSGWMRGTALDLNSASYYYVAVLGPNPVYAEDSNGMVLDVVGGAALPVGVPCGLGATGVTMSASDYASLVREFDVAAALDALRAQVASTCSGK